MRFFRVGFVALVFHLHSFVAAEPIRVAKVAMSAFHTCALISTGAVKCWGNNGFGELGLGDTRMRGDSLESMGDFLPAVDLGDPGSIREVKVTNFMSCVLFESGKVKCWGKALLGDVATNGHVPDSMGVRLPYFSDGASVSRLMLGQNRRIFGGDRGQFEEYFYNGREGSHDLGQRFGTLSALSGSGSSACGLNAQGEIWCWGDGAYGQLGQESVTNHYSPERIGEQLPPVSLGTSVRAIALASTFYGAHCAVTTDRRVKCWGNNFGATLGMGSTLQSIGSHSHEMGEQLPYVNLGIDFQVEKLTGGAVHFCALSKIGRIKCWGNNAFGQLGLGDRAPRGYRPSEMGESLPIVDLGGFDAVDVEAGENSTCAILSNGGLKCWGANTYGQLGIGDVMNRGASPTDMGNNLPFVHLWD